MSAVVPVGLFPEDIAFTSNGAVAPVTNSTWGTVSVVDATTKTVIRTVDPGTIPMQFPLGVLVMPGDAEAWVTRVGGERDGSTANVVVLDIGVPAQASVAATLAVPGSIGRPALTPDGQTVLLPVSDGAGGNPRVLFVNRATRAVETTRVLPPPNPHHGSPIDFAVTVDGRAFRSLFNDGGKAFVIDLASRAFTVVVQAIDNFQHGVAVSPDQQFVVVCNHLAASVSVIDTSTFVDVVD